MLTELTLRLILARSLSYTVFLPNRLVNNIACLGLYFKMNAAPPPPSLPSHEDHCMTNRTGVSYKIYMDQLCMGMNRLNFVFLANDLEIKILLNMVCVIWE
jgi:hypothetical protein